MISINLILDEEIKHMLALEFNNRSQIYNYIIEKNIIISDIEFTKICMIKCEKNIFEYLINFFINYSIDGYIIDLRYMYLLNNVINKYLSKRYMPEKDFNIESYFIDEDINYVLISKLFTENINYIIKDNTYLFTMDSFIDLFNKDINYSNFDTKKTIIDCYYKYNMYKSYIITIRSINTKLYILNNENTINSKQEILNNLDYELKRKYEKLDNLDYELKRKYEKLNDLNNKIDKKDEYLIQLTKAIENDESMYKKRHREYEDRGYNKYQKVEENIRYLTYENTTKRIIDNRREFATSLLKGDPLCHNWSDCIFNDCKKIHIKSESLCPNMMEGFICKNEKEKNCKFIHISRCWANETCTYRHCTRLHTKNMKTPEFQDNFIKSIYR